METNFLHIERGVQNGPITKNRVLPVTTFSSKEICFSLRASYKGLNRCTTTQMSTDI